MQITLNTTTKKRKNTAYIFWDMSYNLRLKALYDLLFENHSQPQDIASAHYIDGLVQTK